jgi:hypothetical protein
MGYYVIIQYMCNDQIRVTSISKSLNNYRSFVWGTFKLFFSSSLLNIQ